LPEPSAEAKAKAAEAKAKTAWSDKVAAYQLCKAQDKVAAAYLKGKDAKAVVATPACTDPIRMCRKSLRLQPARPLLLRQRLQALHLLQSRSKSCLVKNTYSPLKWHFTLNLLVDIGLPDIPGEYIFTDLCPPGRKK
jgi:hypothetical protein